MEKDTGSIKFAEKIKYERDGFVFDSKAEYYKYLIISLLLVIAWVALLAFMFAYQFERE